MKAVWENIPKSPENITATKPWGVGSWLRDILFFTAAIEKVPETHFKKREKAGTATKISVGVHPNERRLNWKLIFAFLSWWEQIKQKTKVHVLRRIDINLKRCEFFFSGGGGGLFCLLWHFAAVARCHLSAWMAEWGADCKAPWINVLYKSSLSCYFNSHYITLSSRTKWQRRLIEWRLFPKTMSDDAP